MINKNEFHSFYESKASCVEESHFILYDPEIRGIYIYSIYIILFVLTQLLWKNDPVYTLIITFFCLRCLFLLVLSFLIKCMIFLWDYVCFILFEGNACYLIVSDQQKYLKCMLCLICTEMWFKVCLKNKICCKKKKNTGLMKLTMCGLWSYLY